MQKVTPVYLMNFLLAVSTTIGMTLIPLLATEKLGMSLMLLGIIEGSTELLSNILRLVTGNLFDRWQNRRFLFILPTTLALISKIILYFPSALALLATKIIERAANGAFAAPRDAFIGEHTEQKGVALGWLSVTKTAGCIIGPLLISYSTIIIGSITEHSENFILLACLISFGSVGCALLVKTNKTATNIASKFMLTELKIFFKPVLPILILAFIFFLGRFNDGLIMIYLRNQGFPDWYYVATISFFNTSMLIVSPILGYYIDAKKETIILLVTIMALFCFNILFFNIYGSLDSLTNDGALQPLDPAAWIFASTGLVMWGIQRAGAQITFTAMIFNRLPHIYYGTAIGIFSVLSGFGVFIASAICGYIAVNNFSYVFLFSGFFSLLALCTTMIFKHKKII